MFSSGKAYEETRFPQHCLVSRPKQRAFLAYVNRVLSFRRNIIAIIDRFNGQCSRIIVN